MHAFLTHDDIGLQCDLVRLTAIEGAADTRPLCSIRCHDGDVDMNRKHAVRVGEPRLVEMDSKRLLAGGTVERVIVTAPDAA
jgi:endogenous inhibitor of DNA gyrase (YacG/DUF329 family)